jgi:ATP-dependent Clp protease ATP-binding subunit ClpA
MAFAEEEDARPQGGASITWSGRRLSDADRRAEELRRLRGLQDVLSERVRGQEHVAKAVASHLIRVLAGVGDSRAARRPVMSAIFAGPTGTGKTQMVKSLAEALGRPLITYDMGSYSQEHTVAGLVGAPPGYVGSDRPGRLVADLAAHPDAVVLLDEIEKAHPKVFDVLLAALDEGRVAELSRGERADATRAVFIMTTNLLAQEAETAWTDDQAAVRAMLREQRFLRPELIGRVDIVALFRPLSRPVLEDIARGVIMEFVQHTAASQGLRLSVDIDQAVLDAVLARCDARFGARDLHRAVADLLGDALVAGYIPWIERQEKPASLRVRVDGGRVVAEYGR